MSQGIQEALQERCESWITISHLCEGRPYLFIDHLSISFSNRLAIKRVDSELWEFFQKNTPQNLYLCILKNRPGLKLSNLGKKLLRVIVRN